MNRVPRPMPGCDIRALPLRPAEAFVLTRIDATSSENDLAATTGMPLSQIEEALDRLFELGAIHFGNPNAPRTPPAKRKTPDPFVRRSSGGSGDLKRPSVPVPPGRSACDRASSSPPLYDPAELDEDVELDRERRRRILDVFYRLDELTHYELLGVSPDADKKQLKSAYYLAAPEFHPD